MSTTTQIAKSEYRCLHCGGKIVKGQEYTKRYESYRGGSDYLRWHTDKNDCQPHALKANCTLTCRKIGEGK